MYVANKECGRKVQTKYLRTVHCSANWSQFSTLPIRFSEKQASPVDHPCYFTE